MTAPSTDAPAPASPSTSAAASSTPLSSSSTPSPSPTTMLAPAPRRVSLLLQVAVRLGGTMFSPLAAVFASAAVAQPGVLPEIVLPVVLLWLFDAWPALRAGRTIALLRSGDAALATCVSAEQRDEDVLYRFEFAGRFGTRHADDIRVSSTAYAIGAQEVVVFDVGQADLLRSLRGHPRINADGEFVPQRGDVVRGVVGAVSVAYVPLALLGAWLLS